MTTRLTHRSHLLGIAAVAGSLALVWTHPALAQSMSTVAADTVVATECSVAVSPLAFGVYDPVVANASAVLDGTATVTLTCTKGAVASVGLDRGLHTSGMTRRLRSGTGDHLTYELHQDATRMMAWGDDLMSMLTLGAATSMAPRYLTVHGRIAGGQDVSGGTYTDSITATVNF